MADDFSEDPHSDETGDGGGPVKSFFEHLEDLRWMRVKSGAALLISMIVCLYGTPTIVNILKRPLKQSALVRVGHTQKAIVRYETNNLATFEPPTNRMGSLDLGSNWVVLVQVQ